jgi:hypothetical protein
MTLSLYLYIIKSPQVLMSRITPKLIVNEYFRNSGYMKPGVDVWKTLDANSKDRFRDFVDELRPGIGDGTKESRLARWMTAIPPHVGRNVMQFYAADPKKKHLIRVHLLS